VTAQFLNVLTADGQDGFTQSWADDVEARAKVVTAPPMRALEAEASFRGLHLAIVHRRQCLMKQSVEQAAAGHVTGGETRLQSIAQRHQFIDLGDDAVLLGEGWEGDRCLLDQTNIKCWLRKCPGGLVKIGLRWLAAQDDK
jgi:hypothetical protein